MDVQWMSNSNTICLKASFTSIKELLYLYQKWVGHICVHLFLSSPVCFTDLYVPGLQSWLLRLYVKSWNQADWLLPHYSSFHGITHSGFFVFPYIFLQQQQQKLPISTKKPCWDFDGNGIKPTYQFGENRHLYYIESPNP